MERRLLCSAGVGRTWRTALLVAAAAWLSHPAALQAGETAVGVNLGLGSAVGFAGLTLTHAIADRARLEVGAGYGYSGY